LNFIQGLSANFALAGITLTTILLNSQLLVKTKSFLKMIPSIDLQQVARTLEIVDV
jgi:hypothetical protein